MKKYGIRVNEVPSLSKSETKLNKRLSNKKLRQNKRNQTRIKRWTSN